MNQDNHTRSDTSRPGCPDDEDAPLAEVSTEHIGVLSYASQPDIKLRLHGLGFSYNGMIITGSAWILWTGLEFLLSDLLHITLPTWMIFLLDSGMLRLLCFSYAGGVLMGLGMRPLLAVPMALCLIPLSVALTELISHWGISLSHYHVFSLIFSPLFVTLFFMSRAHLRRHDIRVGMIVPRSELKRLKNKAVKI